MRRCSWYALSTRSADLMIHSFNKESLILSHLIGDRDISVEFFRFGILGAEEGLGDLVLLLRSDVGGESSGVS